MKEPPGNEVFLFDGKSIANWKAADEGDGSGYGEIHIENGTLVLNQGEPMTAAVWQKSFPSNNYEISLEAMRLKGYDFFCGMTFPVGSSFCSLVVGGWGGYILGLSNIDGLHAAENKTRKSIEFLTNKWYAVRLRVTEKTIEVWLNRKKMITQKIGKHKFSIWPQQELCKPFGISTWWTQGALKNIKFKNLKTKT